MKNQTINKKAILESAKENITNPEESLRYYETLKLVQRNLDYDTRYEDFNELISNLETLREFFLMQYIVLLEGEAGKKKVRV